ncbi:chitobiosyldiphosphodolichol beta-mannosyltransferase-like isoform X11 [Tympanuchus pallidicinctus]|uniref:chitobiosyldiphosphodolichol beta-mannosyltransferase-like isoform X11 n=1 Tax=Tympanuchus pallidicinctus TaxID=109042 RepID=UPI00228711B8|nr:chitobiosyldiphosphodolichol beta-mannosyltransferase-like isoform X11 [Tympanuchus pallidicinctus]
MAAGGGALAASVALVALAALAAMLWRRRAVRGAGRVCVAVLGDLGRSPRMQHHALSLARHGRGVSLLGYFQTRPHGDVLSSGEIRVVPLSELRCSRGLSHASTHSRKQPAASCEDIWPSQKPLKVFERAPLGAHLYPQSRHQFLRPVLHQ